MSLSGHLIVDMSTPGAPHLALSMPDVAGRLIRGRGRDEAVAILPMVHSVCGIAHAHAAAAAMDRALEQGASAALDAARQALVAMERLREHALRILIDWPALIGGSGQPGRAAGFMSLGADLRGALFDADPFALNAQPRTAQAALHVIGEAEARLVDHVFGIGLERWQALADREAIRGWAQAASSPAAAFIAWLLARGSETPASAAPVGETSCFARLRGAPMIAGLESDGPLARSLARLLDLARLPQILRDLLAGKGAATPVSLLEESGMVRTCAEAMTARGALTYTVAMEQGRVASCAISPPTRVNFGPGGIAETRLAALSALPEAARLEAARLLVSALDPCVSWQVRAA
ncbi:MAG: hypothetical protein MRY63_14625 [Neomegalonema sp.]|nr:hypothetical protein [Neomegalonema sp.]